MSIKLEDQTGATITLNATFTIKGLPFSNRSKAIAIAYRDGGREIGDEKLDTRTLELNGSINEHSEADFLTTKNTLAKWLYKKNIKLYFNTAADRYINVALFRTITPDFYTGRFLGAAEIKILAFCPDPFIYYVAQNSILQTIASTGTTAFTINNQGDYDQSAKITIINTADNINFTILNTTDDNRYLTYIDSAFLNGSELIIENDQGLVTMDDTNSIDKMSGNFIRLLPGNNDIEYTGAACGITFEWNQIEI